MAIRKQIILAAASTFLFLYFHPIIHRPGPNSGEGGRLSSLEESSHNMMLTIKQLRHRIDTLENQIDTQTNHNILMERQKREELEESARAFSEQGAGEGVREQFLQKMDSSRHDDIINGRLVSSKGEPVRVIILVGSTARSGTSFLGELLSQFDNVLYLFEPELYIRARTKEMVTEESGIPLLRDMMYCRISYDFASWLKTRSTAFNIFRHPVTKTHCRDWSTCLVPPRLQKACREEHIRVMKVIRIRMAWIKQLLDDPQIDVKVIHLVRDPRGSLYSMAKNQLHKLDPGYYCPLIEDDIIHTPMLMQEYPGKVLGLTYEQLCLDPIGKATELWRFLVGDQEAKLSPKWSLYMEQHISRSSEKKHVAVYGTVRNSNEQYQAWRKDITEHALLEIESNCESVLKRLGLNVFGSLERARNTSYPLFVNDLATV